MLRCFCVLSCVLVLVRDACTEHCGSPGYPVDLTTFMRNHADVTALARPEA